MSRKELPYKIDAEQDIMSVIKIRHEIPYHSRPFMWNRTHHIETVVLDMINAWREDSLKWLGFLIIYNGGEIPAITDGQHRVTISFLMVLALAELVKNDEPLQWISQYGTSSILGVTIPEKDRLILEKYGWTRFPNIYSVYDYDFEALGNLLNRKQGEHTDSKLYEAYDIIKDIIVEQLEDEGEFCNLLRFLNDSVKVTRMVISDWDFAMTAFNALNNIKVSVPNSYLLKNLITRSIGVDKSEQVHAFFNTLAHTYENKTEFIIHQILNMHCRKLMTSDEYDAYLAGNQSDCPDSPIIRFDQFCKSVERYQNVVELIGSDRFGKILGVFASGHEIMNLCLIPLAFMTDNFSLIKPLLRKLVAYGIRSSKKFTFNPLKTQTYIRAITADMFAAKKTVEEACCAFAQLLKEWLSTDTDVASVLLTTQFKGTAFRKARACLLYLAEAKDCHEAALDHSLIHIDHIHPQKLGKKAEPLLNAANVHRLGNLTPLRGSNSEAGMKGNSSLSNKSFSVKVAEYAKSNIAMTRAVATAYGTGPFLDAEIEARSFSLAAEIDALTHADLD